MRVCPVCGGLVPFNPKKTRKYCGAVCHAIAEARRHRIKYVLQPTVDQARHWYRTGGR